MFDRMSILRGSFPSGWSVIEECHRLHLDEEAGMKRLATADEGTGHSRSNIREARGGCRFDGTGRLRNSATVWSSSRANSDTWDLESDVTPAASTRPSTQRVEIPRTQASVTTCTKARSERVRASNTHSGKYEPRRSLGIRSSIEPTRASQRRVRYPFGRFTRSGLCCPQGAPQITSASGDISPCAEATDHLPQQIITLCLKPVA